jgi:hypothetical protein
VRVPGITDKGFTLAAQGLPHLKELHLAWTSSITDLGIQELVISNKNLEKFSLWTSSVTQKGILTLTDNSPNLRVLKLQMGLLTNENLKSIGEGELIEEKSNR